VEVLSQPQKMITGVAADQLKILVEKVDFNLIKQPKSFNLSYS